MPLSDLPKEILFDIASHLDDAGVNALCQTHHQVHDLLNVPLYRRDLTRPQSRSLLWGISNGVKGTVQRAVDAASRFWDPIPEAYNIALQAAAKKGHVDMVELLLKVDGIDSNFGGHSQSAPLIVAAARGHSDVVELLLATAHVDPDVRDQHGASPLYYACKWGYVSVVKQFLSRDDVDINALAFDGASTPLRAACFHGLVEIVDLLLAKDGIDINLYNKHRETPLVTAMISSSVPIVKSLLARVDCDPNIVTSWGNNVLYMSLGLGDVAIIKSLLDHPNIDPNLLNGFKDTALMAVCRDVLMDDARRRPDVVRCLLDTEDVNVNWQDSFGLTAFCYAVSYRQHQIARLLLTRNDIDFNLPDNCGRTPLYWACNIECISLVDLLLKQDGIDPNARESSKGYTPLARACLHNNIPIVASLLSHPDTDPNAVGNDGDSILALVRANRADWYRGELESFLLRADGVDVNLYNDDRETPLMAATRAGNVRVIKSLLTRDDLNPNIVNSDGDHVLHWSEFLGRAIVKRFLDLPNIDLNVVGGRDVVLGSWT
ncbi:Ankyrin repeat-containing domain protein [Elaphomyces granulatus]